MTSDQFSPSGDLLSEKNFATPANQVLQKEALTAFDLTASRTSSTPVLPDLILTMPIEITNPDLAQQISRNGILLQRQSDGSIKMEGFSTSFIDDIYRAEKTALALAQDQKVVVKFDFREFSDFTATPESKKGDVLKQFDDARAKFFKDQDAKKKAELVVAPGFTPADRAAWQNLVNSDNPRWNVTTEVDLVRAVAESNAMLEKIADRSKNGGPQLNYSDLYKAIYATDRISIEGAMPFFKLTQQLIIATARPDIGQALFKIMQDKDPDFFKGISYEQFVSGTNDRYKKHESSEQPALSGQPAGDTQPLIIKDSELSAKVKWMANIFQRQPDGSIKIFGPLHNIYSAETFARRLAQDQGVPVKFDYEDMEDFTAMPDSKWGDVSKIYEAEQSRRHSAREAQREALLTGDRGFVSSKTGFEHLATADVGKVLRNMSAPSVVQEEQASRERLLRDWDKTRSEKQGSTDLTLRDGSQEREMEASALGKVGLVVGIGALVSAAIYGLQHERQNSVHTRTGVVPFYTAD